MNREPVMIAGMIVLVLQWILGIFGHEWDVAYEAPVLGIIQSIILLVGLVWARAKVFAPATLVDAGLNPDEVERQAHANH